MAGLRHITSKKVMSIGDENIGRNHAPPINGKWVKSLIECKWVKSLIDLPVVNVGAESACQLTQAITLHRYAVIAIGVMEWDAI